MLAGNPFATSPIPNEPQWVGGRIGYQCQNGREYWTEGYNWGQLLLSTRDKAGYSKSPIESRSAR